MIIVTITITANVLRFQASSSGFNLHQGCEAGVKTPQWTPVTLACPASVPSSSGVSATMLFRGITPPHSLSFLEADTPFHSLQWWPPLTLPASQMPYSEFREEPVAGTSADTTREEVVFPLGLLSWQEVSLGQGWENLLPELSL